MIIIRNRAMVIPNDEYNLGNDYDTNSAVRVFGLERMTEGVDISNLEFKLDLTYADGTSDTLALDKTVMENTISLTWTITKTQLHVPGTVLVQIRALNVDGNMKWTSFVGAFFAETSMFSSADYSGKLTEIEQFEQAIASEKQRVQNEAARVQAENERIQAEAERKAAEIARQSAESTRQSNETERETWYETAKGTYEQSLTSASQAAASASAAATSEKNASSYKSAAATSATNAANSASAAATSATNAANSASAAATSATNAANSASGNAQEITTLKSRVTAAESAITETNNNLSKKWTIGAKITSTCVPSTDAGNSFNKVPLIITANNPTDGEVAGIGFELNRLIGGALYLASDRNLYFMLNNGTSYKLQMEKVES